MYAFLLVLGAATSVAGIALVASGVSIQDHVFDTTTITPGAVAFIGGLVLIGLGLAVRILKRIERSLAERPMARVVRPADAATGAAEESANQRARIPFPARPKVERHAQPALVVAMPAASAPPVDPASEQSREKLSSSVRLETATVVEESDATASPRLPARAGAEAEPAVNGHAPGHVNGATPAKAAPRSAANARAAKGPDLNNKTAVFESLWPKGSRVGQAAPAPIPVAAPAEPQQRVEPQPAPVVQPQPPQPAPMPMAIVQMPVPQPAPMPVSAPVPVSILKSGVVDGMAYTLYSDGSIEAQFPQGTLRFGSITELRNHIEQSA